MSGRRLAIVLAAAMLVVSACGGSSSGRNGGGAQGSNPTQASSQNDGGNPADGPAAGNGTCSVQITGDVTESWTTKQSSGTVLLTQWLSPTSRQILNMGDNEESMILNCDADAGSVNFLTPNGTTSDLFPMGPKKYVISAGGMFGSDTPGEIGLLFDLKDNQAIWSVSEPGTFTVTSFDKRHFAGSFSAKLKATEDLTTTSATATVSGSFDLDCISDACG